MEKARPYITFALRIIVGAVFLTSGFSKAIDPWGFVFKLEDYLAAMGMSLPRTLTLVGAVGLSALEFISGLMLMFGCFKRGCVVVMTALMAVMLPLTLWTWIADPVADCGCFGELFTLSNALTFWKNVLLTAALIYLLKYNKKLKIELYRPAIQWLPMAATFLYVIFIALYGYNIQPMLDFRPYPEGTNLAELLAEESEDDPAAGMVFIYERDGVTQEFTINNLPDSTWTYVDRIAAESAKAPATFGIFDTDNIDVTADIIPSEGPFMLFVISEPDRSDIAGSYTANEFEKAVSRLGGSAACLIAGSNERIEHWKDISMAAYPCYFTDDTTLKQLVRGIFSAVYIHDGVIKWKLPISTFDFDTVDTIGRDEKPDLDSLVIDHKAALTKATLITIGFLIFLAIFQQFILRFWKKTKKRM